MCALTRLIHRALGGLAMSALVVVCVGRALAAGRHVWWEGESCAATSLSTVGRPYPGDITAAEREVLSGGDWLHTGGEPRADGEPHSITYRVAVPAAGQYHFWVRKFRHHGPFRWRFGEQDWAVCQRGRALCDAAFMRKHFGAYWVFLGMVDLGAGEQTLHVEMLESGGAVDCFVLSELPFAPRGTLRPGETSGAAWPGWFAWEPEADPLRGDCPIDLRYLNEEEAGETGFVRRDGARFLRGDGEVLRFWTLQDGNLGSLDQPLRDYTARRVAKYGVNLARHQCLGLFHAWAAEDEAGFRAALDRLHRAVASYKSAGVYSYLGHLFWHTHVKISREHGFPHYAEPGNPLVSLYVDPHFRQRYLEYLDRVLNTPNPYAGGTPLSREPAVAFVELQNESNVLFWTFKPESWPEPVRELMERAFGDWASQVYGSAAAALEAWGSQRTPRHPDAPEEGRLGLYSAGFFTGQDWAVNGRNPRRAGDQLRFLVELQSETYAYLIGEMRRRLGVRSLITCSNWHTADARILEALERYSNLPGDALCRNTYYGVSYDPRPERFYAIDIGDTFRGVSALRAPGFPKPLTCAHVNDHPYMVTENCWVRPNRYRAEWPFLVTAYASLSGVDGWTFFAGRPASWITDMGVWDVQTPVVMGQFPAAALAYRAGYVREAEPAVTEHAALTDLYAFKGTAMYPEAGTDAMWRRRLGRDNEASAGRGRADPLAFYVGRVDRWLGEGPSRLESVALDEYIDRERERVRSLTGEVDWDFGSGVVTIDTPRVQGACGFLGEAGVQRLSVAEIRSGNEYVSIMAVPLDGRDLADSGRILIQAATEDLPYGFETEPRPDGYARVTAKGGYPLNVRQVDAVVTLANPRVSRALVLDLNGYPTERRIEGARTEDGFRVQLPADSLYVLLE